ncbi:LysM peptidoglycan-binding domain-containing protein [Bacillus sp. B15-48]|uniref:cell division suppressor protein YneA n=1 Tax=Bacillus sp. B15-48 TaxID=1548601 RepID=UPI00193ECE3E|nr:LysM peptidoglycan-binding domain-containing protein [Bacillus sp. B15-48]MBM4763873.1 LysM peptidoglycan-binding domain-containing protein [Bacillus sp. B15-48]
MKKIWKSYSYTILLFATCFILMAIFANDLKAGNDFTTITVQEGESLWSIAEQFSDKHNLTKHEFIVWVERENGINANLIYAGEELVVPILKNKEATTEVAGMNIE